MSRPGLPFFFYIQLFFLDHRRRVIVKLFSTVIHKNITSNIENERGLKYSKSIAKFNTKQK